jgi:hypothetical protein
MLSHSNRYIESPMVQIALVDHRLQRWIDMVRGRSVCAETIAMIEWHDGFWFPLQGLEE